MPTLTAIALGVSIITTGVLTLHDTLRKADHAKGFVTFILTQDMQTNAQTALTCVTSALEQRVTTNSQKIKDISTDFISQSFTNVCNTIESKLRTLNFQSLIKAVREQEQYIIKEDQMKLVQQVSSQPVKKQSQMGFWDSLYTYKTAIQKQIDRQMQQYMSLRRAKQQKALFHVYELYKQSKGIRNDKWITPYNMLMLVLFGIGSFFVPKLTIMLAISYFITSQIYLLSDTLRKATESQIFDNLKFDNVIQFHVAIMAGLIGMNRYRVYKETRGYPGSKYKGLSLSF